MKVSTKKTSETEAVLTIVAETAELTEVKKHVLKALSPQVKVPGFRAGKTPPELVEKHVNQNTLQSEFLEHAVNDLYPDAIKEAGLRPVDRPKVEIIKFVPFGTLEFTATIPVLGEIKLGNYKALKAMKPDVKVTAKDIDEVLASLRRRSAKAADVDRAAKKGDQVVIDFKGVNDRGEAVKGAEGTGYELGLGTNMFIPGFEDNLIGLKAGDQKTFTLPFPKDYSVGALAGRKVTFDVTVQKVQQLEEPALDDAFAASVGPVKTVADLKADIKRELEVERQRQAKLDYESDLIKQLAAKSKLTIPDVLIDDQVDRMLRELQQNLVYRGQTIQEFLKTEGKTEEQYKKEVIRPQAEERLRAGLVIAEVGEREKLDVTAGELEAKIAELRAQYPDAQMQTELDKPENRREIASRLLSEKTIAKIVSYAK